MKQQNPTNHGTQAVAYQLAPPRNQADVAELLIYDVIGSWSEIGEVSAKEVARQLNAIDASVINVRINSVGGATFDAKAIYNSLRRHKARIEVDIEGVALSAASYIAMAGDEIRIAGNALLMIHDVWICACGNADELREQAALCEKETKIIAETYAARSGMDVEHVRSLMSAETWFTADEAVEHGLADQITAERKVAALGDVSKFKNAPREKVAALIDSNSKANPKTKKHKDKDMSASDTDAAPATAAELKKAFPDDADFALDCLAKDLTLLEAKAAYADHLQARLQNREQEIEQLKKDKAEARKASKRNAARNEEDEDDDTSSEEDDMDEEDDEEEDDASNEDEDEEEDDASSKKGKKSKNKSKSKGKNSARKPSGAKRLNQQPGASTKAGASDDFDASVRSFMDKGHSRLKAINLAAKADPEAHEAWKEDNCRPASGRASGRD